MTMRQTIREHRVSYAVVVAVLALAVVLGVVLAGRGDDGATGDGATATATAGGTVDPVAPTTSADPAAPTSSVPAPAPLPIPAPAPAPEPGPAPATVAADDVSRPPPTLPAVALDQPVDAGNGVTARLVSLEAVDGQATGPGNVAGPALRVTVRLSNATGQTISLDDVTVTMSSGGDATPASPLDDPSQAPFAGALTDGGDREARYVFSVPVETRDRVTVDVAYQAGLPVLQFSGPVR